MMRQLAGVQEQQHLDLSSKNLRVGTFASLLDLTTMLDCIHTVLKLDLMLSVLALYA